MIHLWSSGTDCICVNVFGVCVCVLSHMLSLSLSLALSLSLTHSLTHSLPPSLPLSLSLSPSPSPSLSTSVQTISRTSHEISLIRLFAALFFSFTVLTRPHFGARCRGIEGILFVDESKGQIAALTVGLFVHQEEREEVSRRWPSLLKPSPPRLRPA